MREVEHNKSAEKIQTMFGAIAPSYDLTNSVLSLGVHHWWKCLAAREVRGADLVVDVATGTGDLVGLLRRRARGVVGVDFCRPMLDQAEARFGGELRCEFVQGDALHLPIRNGSVDCVTVSFGVRNFENLHAGLVEIRRVLKDGGKLVVLEFGKPRWKPFEKVYAWYSAHLMPLIGGWLSGNRAAYEYLPSSAAEFPCGEDFEAILRGAGFAATRTRSLTGGIAYLYVASK